MDVATGSTVKIDVGSVLFFEGAALKILYINAANLHQSLTHFTSTPAAIPLTHH